MPVFGELQASSAPQMPGGQQGQLLADQRNNVSRSECYLGLPLHASQGDAQQHRHSDDPNDSDVIGGVHDKGIVLLGKENDSQCGNKPVPYQTTVFSMSFSSHCLIISGPMIPQILVINTDFARRRWGRRGGGGNWDPEDTEPLSYLQQVPDSFGKAHCVHGHGHRVCKSKDQPDGAAQLRPKAP